MTNARNLANLLGGSTTVPTTALPTNIQTLDVAEIPVSKLSLGSNVLTQSFDSNQSIDFNLTDSVNASIPIVSAFKEVPQQGFSSKGQWDVNANATNYEFFDEKPYSTYASSTLTPSATGDGTFTSSDPVAVEFDVANMTYNNKTYDFSTQSTQPEGGGWGNNGTVFFMCTYAFNRMYSYTASTAYDISTLTYDNKYITISSPYSAPCDVIISADGTKFWGTGRDDVIVGEFVMSTAFDLSTASYNNSSLDMSAQLDGNARTISFGDNGTKLYATGFSASFANSKVVQYNLSTAYDLSTATYSGNSINVPSPPSVVSTAKINADGTKMLIARYRQDQVDLYTLSTAYDLSTATYSGISYNFSSIVNTTNNSTCGGTINPDGSEFYYFGGYNVDGNVYQFNMGGSSAFNSSDIGKKVVGNSGSAIITATSGTYQSITPFADTSAISSWQLFGAQGKADGSGIELSGYSTQADIVFPTGANGSGASMVYSNNVSPTASVFDHLRSVVFNNEGTIALLLKAGQVLRFNLSTAFDLSTMTEVTNDNFTSQLNSNQFGIVAKPDGTRIWVSDYGIDVIKQFTLSTPWSPSTQSYDGYYLFNNGGSWSSFSGGGGAPSSTNFNPFSFQFNSDGTKLLTILWDNNPYHSIAEFTLSTGWDMSTMSYTSYANLVGNSDPEAIAISADGLKLMMHGSGLGDAGVEVYSLPSAFSVGTAGTSLTRTSGAMDLSTLTGNSGNNITYGGLSMSSDGKRMWTIYNNNSGANPIYEITGGTTSVHPYSIYSPALTNSSNGQINSSSWLDINSMTADETKNDGDIFYAVSTDNRTSWGVAKASDGVRKIVKNNSGTWQYNNDGGTFTPVSSLADAEYSSQFSIAGASNKLRDIIFNSDGTKMYLLWFSPDVKQFSLSTAYDISTAVYDSISLNTNSEETLQTGMKWNNDGTKLYIIGYSNDKVHEYILTTAYDLSTASYNNVFFSVSSQMATPFGLTFKYDGTKMYVADNGGNIYQYSLSTAWDMSSSAYDNISFSIGVLSEGIIFNSLGTKLYYVNSNILYRWNLSTAWDISTLTSESSLDIDSDLPSNGLSTGLAFNGDESNIYVTWRNADGVATINLSVLGYSTSETWVNGTNNNEHATLQEALGAQSFNRMNKAQLDAVADAYHFSQDSADTLDLMIAPYAASGSSPISDGVTINYDAEAIVREAVNGTDYVAEFPQNDKVKIKSLIDGNLKIRII